MPAQCYTQSIDVITIAPFVAAMFGLWAFNQACVGHGNMWKKYMYTPQYREPAFFIQTMNTLSKRSENTIKYKTRGGF